MSFALSTTTMNKTTIESATAELEEETGSYQQLSFSQAAKKNHDALAELEKQFVQWRMLSPRIEDEVAARMNLLAELSKEARGVRERGGKALKRSVRIGG
jgi:hypothetical protein